MKDELIWLQSMAVGHLDVKFEWWGIKVPGESGSIPTRTIIRIPIAYVAPLEYTLEFKDGGWISPVDVKVCVIAYLEGMTLEGNSRAAASATKELALGRPVSGKPEVESTTPRFTVDKVNFESASAFMVYDNEHNLTLMRDTEEECKKYADSLNNHNLKKV